MDKSRKKVLISIITLLFLIVGILLFRYIIFDDYKGKVSIKDVKSYTSVLSADVSQLTGNAQISDGYDTVKYTIKYTLDNQDNILRDVIVDARLTASESKYARFKDVKGNGITSTVSDDGIIVNLSNVPTNEEQTLELELVITNAPYGFKVRPNVTVRESTSSEQSINLEEITVNRNSIEGFVINEDGNKLPSIELSLYENGNEVRRTYTNSEGEYVFGNLNANSIYTIKLEEETYKKVRFEDRSLSDEKKVLDLIVKSVDPFSLDINKTIIKLKLNNNGKEEEYLYADETKVLKSVKNLKNLSGSIYYKITVKNTGEVDGTIGSIQDIVPDGLSFDASKNPGWEEKNDKLYYRVLEDQQLSSYEERSAYLTLDIEKTNIAKTYINEAIGKSEEYKNVIFLIDGNVYKDIYVLAGETIDNVTISDDNFSGWYTDANYTNKYKFGKEVDKNMILYGSLTSRKCHVTFIDNGSTLREQDIDCGSKVSSISATGKLGYTFRYWSLNNQEYDFNSNVIEDLTLVSYYEIDTYNITYDLVDGTLDVQNPITYTVESDDITLHNPSKEGYTFTGWTGSNGNTPSNVTISHGSTGDKNYVANYSINNYTLTINPYGGEYEGSTNPVSLNRNYGETVTISNPSKDGYTFTSWTLDGKGTLNNNQYTYGAGNGRLTANYTPINYTISVDLNGGSTATAIPQNYNIESDSITLPIPTKQGFTFIGWTGTGLLEPTMNVTIPTGSMENRSYTANYSINGYTLTVNPNGGIYNQSSNPININNDYGTIITLDNPTRTGYEFTGWTLTGNGSLVENVYTYSDGNGTVTANWEIITYEIHYSGLTQAEETSLTNPTTYNVETSFSLNNPQNRLDDEGDVYERFTGWTYGNTTEANVTIPTGTTGDITFTANFVHVNPDTYVITYDTNGGTLSEQNPTSYTKKDNAITLHNPSKEGYTFTGWTGSNGTTPEETVTIPHGTTGDLNYVANYTPITYTISYSGITSSEVQTLGLPTEYTIESNDISLATPSKEGYTFTGWTGSNGTTPGNVTIPHGSTGNKNYTANFIENGYSIHYELNGGTVSEDNPISYTVESNSITLHNPTKNGYTFAGWTGSNGTTPELTVTIPTGSTGDRNYTANYTPITYTISYSGLEQSEIDNLQNPEEYTIETPSFNLANPSREGYTFTGWTGSNGNNPASVTISQGTTGNKTYTANFVKINYTISYNYKDGIPSEENPTSYSIESDTITLHNPTKEGYTFLGWTGTGYPGLTQTVTIPAHSTGNRSYEAHYNADEYTISYSGLSQEEKDRANNPESYTIESNDITLNRPTREGYTFTGWTGSNGDSPQLNITINHGSTGNKTYTANFDINSYTVTYMNGVNIHGTDVVEFNNKTTAPTVDPVKSHSYFLHWSLTENGTAFDFDTPIQNNTTLYAVFGEIEIPTITHTPTSWTNDKVTVNITSSHNDYEYYYKIDDGSYTKFENDFDVSTNSTIYAYSVYGNGTSSEASHNITNIDKIDPSVSTTEEPSVHTAQINITLQDNESGIKSYSVYVEDALVFNSDDYTENLNDEKNEIYTLTNLDASTTYSYKIVALDVAGNETEYEDSVTTLNAVYVARIIGMGGVIFDDESQYTLFESLQSAIDYCSTTQCTIQLIPDELEESVTVIQGQDITLDLDGKTLYSSESNTIENNGTLVIVDNSDGQLVIGQVINTNPIGNGILNNGTLDLGKDDGAVSITKPQILATNTGIYNNSVFRLYDGRIQGNESVHGEVSKTPYSYNAVIPEDIEPETMFLQIVDDPEARIKNKYYTKLTSTTGSSAMGDSKSGTMVDDEETSYLSQIVQVGDYGFIYNPIEDSITSENIGIDSESLFNSTAISMLKLDLTEYTNNQMLTINYSVSSQQDRDYGYVTILEEEGLPAYNSTTGRIILTSGTVSNFTTIKELEGGKVYYIYFGYYKNYDYSYGHDYFKINALYLSNKGVQSITNSLISPENNGYAGMDGYLMVHDLSGTAEDSPIFENTINSPRYNSSKGTLDFSNNSFNFINPYTFTTEETVDIEFSSNAMLTGGQTLYRGNGSEKIAISYYNDYVIIGLNNNTSTYVKPAATGDGNKHRITIIYDNGIYTPYFDGVPMEVYNENSYINSYGYSVLGTANVSVYKLKVYDKALSIQDIDDGLYSENLKTYYDFSNSGIVSKINEEVVVANNKNSNTASSYIIYDLRDSTEDMNVVVNYNNYLYDSDYGQCFIVTNNSNVPTCNRNTAGVITSSSSVGFKTLTLTAGQLNYVHFVNYKGGSNYNQYIFINSITAISADSTNRIYEPLKVDDSNYHFNKYYNITIKDLAGQSDYVDDIFNSRYDNNTKSLVFRGNSIMVNGDYTLDAGNEETVDIEFSTTNTSNKLLYSGKNSEPISVGVYAGYIVVSTQSYQRFVLPSNIYDGTKHRITVNYYHDDQNNIVYDAYFDGQLLSKAQVSNDRWGTLANRYIGGRNEDNSYYGSIYSIKVYDKSITPTEIDSNPINENILLGYDMSSSNNVITDNNAYYNNNQALNSTVAHSYLLYDLTQSESDKYISIDYTISSEERCDIGYVTVSNSPTDPGYDNAKNRYIYVSGQSNGSAIIKLSKGKLNYVHLGYRKDHSTNKYNDSFIINSIRDNIESSNIYSISSNNILSDEQMHKVAVLNEEISEVEILKNITLSSSLVIPEEKEVVLDLSGHTLSISKAEPVINNKGVLHIKDSKYSSDKSALEEEYQREVAQNNATYAEELEYYNDLIDQTLVDMNSGGETHTRAEAIEYVNNTLGINEPVLQEATIDYNSLSHNGIVSSSTASTILNSDGASLELNDVKVVVNKSGRYDAITNRGNLTMNGRVEINAQNQTNTGLRNETNGYVSSINNLSIITAGRYSFGVINTSSKPQTISNIYINGTNGDSYGYYEVSNANVRLEDITITGSGFGMEVATNYSITANNIEISKNGPSFIAQEYNPIRNMNIAKHIFNNASFTTGRGNVAIILGRGSNIDVTFNNSSVIATQYESKLLDIYTGKLTFNKSSGKAGDTMFRNLGELYINESSFEMSSYGIYNGNTLGYKAFSKIVINKSTITKTGGNSSANYILQNTYGTTTIIDSHLVTNYNSGYIIYNSVNGILNILGNTVLDGNADVGIYNKGVLNYGSISKKYNTVYDYDYTGNVQEFIAPTSGNYRIETWGASGGHGHDSTTGGLGGYTSGDIYLEAGTKLYIYVGERGIDTTSSSNGLYVSQGVLRTRGAYNGGGLNFTGSQTSSPAGTGGGATDISISGEENSEYYDHPNYISKRSESSYLDRIMVAGGGAGRNGVYSRCTYGGSLSLLNEECGERVISSGSQTSGTFGYAIGTTTTGSKGAGYFTTNDNVGYGGTSYISGYTGSVAMQNSNGSLKPISVDGVECSDGTTDVRCSYHTSGYIFTNTIMKAGYEEMPNYDGTATMYGNFGNGHAKITLLDNYTNVDVDDEYPKISVNSIGISQDRTPNDSILNFYSGSVNVNNGRSLETNIDDKPENYDIISEKTGNSQKVYLSRFDSQEENAYNVAIVDSSNNIVKKYVSIQEAIDDVPDDTSNTTNMIVLKDIVTSEPINIPNTKNIKLDYKGHVVESYTPNYLYNNEGIFSIENTGSNTGRQMAFGKGYIYNNGTFEVNKISLLSHPNEEYHVVNNGTLTYNNVNTYISISGLPMGNNIALLNNSTGTFNMNGGRFDIRNSSNNPNGLDNFGTANLTNITVASTSFENNAVNRYIFKNEENATLIIDNMTTSNYDINTLVSKLLINDGMAEIKNSTISSNPIISSGDLLFDNVTYGPSDYGSVEVRGDGTTTFKDSSISLVVKSFEEGNIVFRNSNLTKTMTLDSAGTTTIESGSIIVSNGNAIRNTGSGALTLGIKGDGSTSITNPEISGLKYGIYSDNDDFEINIYDGIIKGTTAAIVGSIKEVETGYAIDSSIVDGKENKYLVNTPAVKNLTTGNEYFNLNDAYGPANNGDTLQLLRNITVLKTDASFVNTKDLTIDLNDYTIDVSKDDFIINNGTLTLINSPFDSANATYSSKVSETLTKLNNGQIVYKTYDYPASDTESVFVAPYTGTYRISLWGAQGGDGKNNTTKEITHGGKGAFTTGTIYLEAGEKLYVHVGKKPSFTDRYSLGGKATDVSTESGNINSRIMVAGAGGGAYTYYATYDGGIGGKLVGGSGIGTENSTQATGGTQTSGGIGFRNNTSLQGSFGYGYSSTSFQVSSGGDGYYGGGAGYRYSNTAHHSGAGGSSFISGYTGAVAVKSADDSSPRLDSNDSLCSNGTSDITCSYHYSGKVFSNPQMFAGDEEFVSKDGILGVGNEGDGYARITLISTSEPTAVTYTKRDAEAYVSSELSIDRKEETNGAIKTISTTPIVTNNGTLTINSGIYKDCVSSTKKALFENTGTLVVNGGLFRKEYTNIESYSEVRGSIFDNSSSLTITGGTFDLSDKYLTSDNAVIGYTTAIVNSSGATTNVTGGHFKSTSDETVYANGRLLYNEGTINIKGINSNYSSIGYNSGIVTLNDIVMEDLIASNTYLGETNDTRCRFYERDYCQDLPIGIFINNGTVNIIGGSYNTDSQIIYNNGTLKINETGDQRTIITFDLVLSDRGSDRRIYKNRVFYLTPSAYTTINNTDVNSQTSTHNVVNRSALLLDINNSSFTATNTSEIIYNSGIATINVNETNMLTKGLGFNNNGAATININNSNIKSTNNNAINNTSAATMIINDSTIVSDTTNGIYNTKELSLTLGTKGDGIISNTSPLVRGKTYGVNTTNNNMIFNFYDGIVEGTTAAISAPLSDLESGYIIVDDTEDVDGVTYKSRYLDRVEVAQNTRTLEKYFDLPSAFGAAMNNDTIKMINNYTSVITDPVIEVYDTLTLDLNGFDIYNSLEYQFENHGILNITDSSNNNDGLYYASSGTALIDNFGTLNIYDINLESKEHSLLFINEQGGTLNITNGSNLYTTKLTSLIRNAGDITIIDSSLSNYYDGSWSGVTINKPIITNESTGTASLKDSSIVNNGGYGRRCSAYNCYYMYPILNYGQIEIDNCQFGGDNSTGSIIFNESTGDATIKNVIQQTPVDITYNKGTITIQDSDIMIRGNVVYDDSTAFDNMTGTATITDTTFRTGSTVVYDSLIKFRLRNATLSNVNVIAPNHEVRIYIGHGTTNIDNLSVTGENGIKTSSIFYGEYGTATFRNSSIETTNTIFNLDYNMYLNAYNSTFISDSTDSAVAIWRSGSTFNFYSGIIDSKGNAINLNDLGGNTVSLGTNDAIYNQSVLTITADKYAVNNNTSSVVNFYDGYLKGKQGANRGGIANVEDGYKLVTGTEGEYTTGYQSRIDTTEAIAESNNVSFNGLQTAINYAVRNNTYVTLVSNYTLDDNLTASGAVVLYLNGYNLNYNGYTVSSDIDVRSGSYNPSGSVSNILGNLFGINSKNKEIIIYEMNDGSVLNANVNYRLYKDNELQKLDEEEAGTYSIGSDLEVLKPIKGRIYIRNVSSGNYKLVGSDNKEISFSVDSEGNLTGNVKEYTIKSNNYISNSKAELIITIQTGIRRVNYMLIAISLIAVLSIMFVIKKNRESNS